MHNLSPDYWKKIFPFSFSFHLLSSLAHKCLFFFFIRAIEMELLAHRKMAQARMDFTQIKCCSLRVRKTIWITNLLINTPTSNIHPKSNIPKSWRQNMIYGLHHARNKNRRTCQKSRLLLHPNSILSSCSATFMLLISFTQDQIDVYSSYS